MAHSSASQVDHIGAERNCTRATWELKLGSADIALFISTSVAAAPILKATDLLQRD
jgi:hypothetical protein